MKNKRGYRVFLFLLVLLGIFIIVFVYTFNSNNPNNTLFEKISSSTSNIHFINSISYNNSFNIYTYNNFYSGGGVGLGDINNDGLLDIYLVSNQKSNKLYLNKGNFEFKDITEKAGVSGTKPWSTGVSMVDINGDGLLDIYVCNAGLVKGKDRENELFINNGDLSFTERAEKFGIADSGFSTQASFFDYDKDSDLDMYLLNYTPRPINSFDQSHNLREQRDFNGGDRLYRNNLISDSLQNPSNSSSIANKRKNQPFSDITKQAGIYSSAIGFGLGATVGDVNNDGWMDIYISNDFFERDYLYVNKGNGTFKEVLKQQMNSISTTSMSGDIADLNNDGSPEVFIADMLPEHEKRIKTLTDFIGWDKYQSEIERGYYRKFERNMLHYNDGNGTFSEIGRYAGIEATDWSWGGLIADFNLDGRRDIFVPNGVYKDMTNKDFLVKLTRENVRRSFAEKGRINYKKLTKKTPTNALSNYMFMNQGNFQFVNRAADWGLDTPSFSNGASYGDLDNDGDLDLVVNNVNMKSFIYRNRATELHPKGSWLELTLKGQTPNTFGVGAQVKLSANGHHWYAEQMLQRGFQSSVDPTLYIGLTKGISRIDTARITWPDGRVSLQTNLKTRQRLIIKQSKAQNNTGKTLHADSMQNVEHTKNPLLTDITEKIDLNWRHKESSYNDFNKSPLLFHMRSTDGPPLCIGDINNDGYEDFYVGGAAGQPGAIFLQQKDSNFVRSSQPVLDGDRASEDTDCTFFDANGDKKPELYVASGSNEFPGSNHNFADRLYKFNEEGELLHSEDALPEPKDGYKPTGVVRPADIDKDGDLDLFIGIRMDPSAYGVPVGGRILLNDGTGKFKNKTSKLAPELRPSIMKTAGITDAAWGDLNGDDLPDLVVAGEWMPLAIFYNQNGHLERAALKDTGLNHTSGWWQSILLVDLNNDGALDIVGGNYGLNSQFQASAKQPIQMWVGDLDYNGTIEQIIATIKNGKGPYPIALRQNLIQQLPYLKLRYPTFLAYAGKTVNDIFTQKRLEEAIHYQVEQLASIVGWNKGDGSFNVKPLPFGAQLSPVYSILAEDLDANGRLELILGGNLSSVKPQAGPYYASYGVVLRQDSVGTYRQVPIAKSGFFCRGEIRVIHSISSGGKKLIFVARNNKKLKVFKVNNRSKDQAM